MMEVMSYISDEVNDGYRLRSFAQGEIESHLGLSGGCHHVRLLQSILQSYIDTSPSRHAVSLFLSLVFSSLTLFLPSSA